MHLGAKKSCLDGTGDLVFAQFGTSGISVGLFVFGFTFSKSGGKIRCYFAKVIIEEKSGFLQNHSEVQVFFGVKSKDVLNNMQFILYGITVFLIKGVF